MTARRARVLLVEDSRFMRMALRRIIEAEGDIDVVEEAEDGEAAIAAAERLSPDVVVMDLVLPGMGGVEATRRIVQGPAPPAVIVVSAFAPRGSAAARAAFEEGAVECLSKIGAHGLPDLGRMDRDLRGVIRHWALQRQDVAPPLSPVVQPPRHLLSEAPDIVLLGASSGGPGATAALLAAAGRLDVPVVIAQHLPVGLADEVAAALAARIARPVLLAEDGARPGPGDVLMLPDGLDGALRRDAGGLRLALAPASQPLSPSVDILFASAATAARNAIGVVLSGMGRDGLQGARAMAGAGMPVLAQSAASCLVGGMPGALEAEGLALASAAPASLGERIAAMCSITAVGRIQ